MWKRIFRRLGLASRILETHWAQPATALWRIFEAEVVRDHLVDGERALDLGCGDGTLAPVLLEWVDGHRWIGVDLDTRETRLARERGPYRAVFAASAGSLPLKAESQELIFSNSALEHMENLERVIAEIARCLEAGGRFAFTVPTRDFHACLLWPKILRRTGARERAALYLRKLDRRLQHVAYLSRSEWRRLLSEHGLEARIEVPYLSPTVCTWWETVANLTGGLAHMLWRGRRSPRQIQLALHVAGRPNRALGAVAFAALLPILLWSAAVEREPRAAATRRRGALFIEAWKPERAA